MAIELIEGWDEFATADIALRYTNGSSTIDNAGRVTGRCVAVGNSTVTIPLPSNARYTVGFAFKLANTGTSTQIIRLREGTTEHCRIEYLDSNAIQISRAGSIAAASAGLGLVADVWYYLEVDYTVHDSAGAWEVRLNEVPIIGPTGSLDTRNGGTGVIDNMLLIQNGGNARRYDDMYFASGSSSFQGDCRVITSWPTADGNYTDWAASAGADYQCVDDATQNGDTDYISTSTSGHKWTGVFGALGVTGTIKAVAVALWGRKDDAGARTIGALYRRASTDHNHPNTHTLSTNTAGYQGTPWEQDPQAGPGAWTVTNVDAGEFGVRNV